MKSLFKSLGRGILYFFTPFVWVIGMAIGSVIGLVVFLGYALYSIFLFFTGRNMFRDLPEDEKLKELREAQANTVQQPIPQQPQPQFNQYQQPVMPQQPSQAPQYQEPQPQTEEYKPEAVLEEPVQENPYQNNDYIEENNNDSFEEEQVEEYVPEGEDFDDTNIREEDE